MNAGLLCGSGPSNVSCGACTTDAQCQADPFYGSTFICNTANGPNKGKCVTASCTPNNSACMANGSDFCCGGSCTAGNCCTNTDCANNAMFGNGYTCTNNTCTKCDGIMSNTYFVDPINGNDTTATGSGKASGAANAGCSFKTITRAMQLIGTVAGVGTRVVIVGSGTAPTGLAAGDALPITVQPNVTISTTGGAVTITLPAATNQGTPTNTSGFILSTTGAGIAGDPAAPLTIDGNGNTSGVAVAVTGRNGQPVERDDPEHARQRHQRHRRDAEHRRRRGGQERRHARDRERRPGDHRPASSTSPSRRAARRRRSPARASSGSTSPPPAR